MSNKRKKEQGDISELPIEVQLAYQVKSCRTCKWFWGEDKPYGPYPAYDFLETFPEKVKHQYKEDQNGPVKWLNAKTKGLRYIDPAVMHGCRKAPIMTIGINPNLTAFRANPRNDTWAYPKFEKDEDGIARYAYYYRYQTIYQESFPKKFLQGQISKDENDIVRAKKSGWLKTSTRSNTSRWMMLTIKYVDGTEETVERTWKQNEDYAVNFYANNNKKKQFNKGEIIAAKLHLKDDLKSPVDQNVTGYYVRFIPVLDTFMKLIKDSENEKKHLIEKLKKINLTVGEDVSQHDMIACASPGWTSIYDIPTYRVIQNCVEDNSWVVQQVIQSQPKAIVLVGGSSMAMFLEIFEPFMDLDRESKDYFQLIKRTCEEAHYMEINEGKYHLKSRIICSPHFSYPNNFQRQFRFLNEEWKTFENKFPSDYRRLLNYAKEDGPFEIKQGYDSTWEIKLKDENGDLKKIVEELNPDAREEIMTHYYDVNELMAKALKQEYDKGNLKFDFKTGHLERTFGPCHFCVNERWEFPQGCEYGKDKEKKVPSSEYMKVLKAVIKKAKQFRDNKKLKKTNLISKIESYKFESSPDKAILDM